MRQGLIPSASAQGIAPRWKGLVNYLAQRLAQHAPGPDLYRAQALQVLPQNGSFFVNYLAQRLAQHALGLRPPGPLLYRAQALKVSPAVCALTYTERKHSRYGTGHSSWSKRRARSSRSSLDGEQRSTTPLSSSMWEPFPAESKYLRGQT